jgi:hypothetical protein
MTSPFPSYTPHVPAKPKTLSRQKIYREVGRVKDLSASLYYSQDVQSFRLQTSKNVQLKFCKQRAFFTLLHLTSLQVYQVCSSYVSEL